MLKVKWFDAIAIFLFITLKLILVLACYLMISYLTLNYLLDVYETDTTMKVSFPSAGFLVISVHLFWLVIFMVPSWDHRRIQTLPSW